VTKLATREEQAVEGRVSYGSYDTTETAFGLNHALTEPSADVQHARLDVSHNTSNGYIDRQKRDAWSVAFSLLSDLTPDLSHTLALEYQTNTKTARTGARRCSTQQGWRVEDRQTQPLQQLQRRGRALRTAHDLGALDHRLPDQRQHHPAQHAVSPRQPARLPQPRNLSVQRRQQRGEPLHRVSSAASG
jgi:hypothetical protein